MLIHWLIDVVTYSVLRWYRTCHPIVILSTDVECLLLYSGPLMDRNLAQMLLCILIVYLFIFFIFNSGIVSKILSQMCGRLYFPVFLLRVGLFTLIYIDSLMVLAKVLSFLPMILKFSMDVSCVTV